MGDVDIEEVLLSNKISFSEKKTISILLAACITVTKIGYDEQTKWIYFLIKDDDLFKKCKTICDKFIADIKKEFDSEPVYNKNCLKTK